jgi:hypothetical protein
MPEKPNTLVDSEFTPFPYTCGTGALAGERFLKSMVDLP